MRINKATKKKWVQTELSMQLSFIRWMQRTMNAAYLEQIKLPLPINEFKKEGLLKAGQVTTEETT